MNRWKFSLNFSIFLLFLASGIRVSEQLDCTQIATNDQVSGKTLTVPDNAPAAVAIPANFSCSYTITPPRMVYAQITVTNGLNGVNDVIKVSDGQGKTTVINRNYPKSNVFYVFSQTSTTVKIDNWDDGTKFLMTVVYSTLPTATQSPIQINQNINYFYLNTLQLKPVTVTSNERIVLILGRSGHITDDFTNYFVLDGPLDAPKTVLRLEDFQTSNFTSTGNSLTVVGLDNQTSFSTVIFNPLSSLQGFQKIAGVTVAEKTGSVTVRGSNGVTTGVMIVAPNSPQLVLTSMGISQSSDSCVVKAVTGPPNYSGSKELINFVTNTFSVPQRFPFPYFSIIVQNCIAQFSFATATPSDYYKVNSDKNGFIFSPSYFNSDSKSDFNVTFEYTGDDNKQFVVEVVDLTVTSNGELDINILDANLKKSLSAVITGDQIGTRSKAFGKYLNVHMSGDGATKLRWQLSSSSLNLIGLPAIIVSLAILMISL